jgi:drug/metabolite transporter (DMT)-like permease
MSRSGQALLWMSASGLIYSLLNALLRTLSLRVDAFQTLGLVYASSLVVLLPLVLSAGVARYWPQDPGGLVMRGGVHWLGMCIWLVAVSRITLAETTAIGFVTPLFIMTGAALLLNEPLRWDRSAATFVGSIGVLVVVAPKATGLSGPYVLLMLGSAVLFAASFLLSKRLTRVERPSVIVVWQSVVVTLLSIPMAALRWQPQPAIVWLTAVICGLLATVGNYCLMRAFSANDISASQPAKFLDLLWACLLGWLLFGDRPESSTVAGGLIILTSTIWIARRS